MLPNKDKIARPVKGQAFPVTVGEAVRLLGEFGFRNPPGQRRLDLVFMNQRGDVKLGRCVAGFYPSDTLVVCSVPEHCRGAPAQLALRAALEELATFELTKPYRENDRVETSYWAYLQPLNILHISKRTRKARHRTFRGGGRLLSNVASLSKNATSEVVLRVVELEGQSRRD